MHSTIMEKIDTIIDSFTAERVKALRQATGLTLDMLAERSGVSRAMISRIERGETSPTAALLARLAAALGHSLSSFFAAGEAAEPFWPRKRQHVWIDPQTGYLRRAVSPPATGSGVDLVEVFLPAGKQVQFPPQASSRGLCQHVWVLQGELMLDVAGVSHRLGTGDCLYHDIGIGHAFRNPTDKPVRYAVVLEHGRKG